MSIGIYMIKNKINNKVYIGKSKNIEKRINKDHKKALIKNKHNNKHLQLSWNKYNENNFEFNIIEECNEELLDEKEKYWIDYYRSYDNQYGYNKTMGGDGGILTPEGIEKMRKSLKGKFAGKKNPMYGKKGKLNPNYGIKRSKAWIINLKHKLIGHEVSNETRGKISNYAKTRVGEKNAFYGKKHTIETKENIRQKQLGKKLSNETKEKISIALKGKPNNISECGKENIRKSKYKLTDNQVIEILKRLNNKEKYNIICDDYKVSKNTILRIQHNETYKHINRSEIQWE